MHRRTVVSGLAALALGGSAVAFGAAAIAAVPGAITAALADKARPAADSDRDAARKPGELLALGEVKPGQKVADFMMGGGYFTRILAPAVGDKGHVYAYQSAEFIGFRAAYGTDQTKVVGDYKNVTALTAPVTAAGLPDGLDLVLTVQNYHDLHLNRMPAGAADTVNKQVFKALKPGGVYLIVDHAAAPGTPTDEAANKLHRIDVAVVKKEVEAAGFKLVSEDDKLLGNPADDHTLQVFQPAIRGKTDQFVLKYRKPK